MTAPGPSPAAGAPPPPRLPSWRVVRRVLRAFVLPLQHAAATAVGLDEETRVETVEQMLDSNARRAPGYWIQLALASGIAILGLVLGSTAVVIGAMLVSPLMGPIIELGMGFAIGSSFLVIRSALRVVMSVVGVVAGTALFTMVLPFHEVTAEITSRTAPTALDLLVAVFCALTAAYTTVRRTSDTTAAAAGTAIGIALVPPLCVIGYGIGTADGQVAGGSALLLTANFSAILLFAVLSFLLLGYDKVDALAMESRLLTSRATRVDRAAARAEAGLRRAFGSRYGWVARLLVPGLFLAAVYFPLTSALDQVTKQVRDRAAVQRILETEVPDAVEQSVTVERDAVSVRLLIIGDGGQASAIEQRLATRIAAETQIVPVVRVLAVPDADALARATSVPETVAPRLTAVEEARSRLGSDLVRAWPTQVAGLLAGWSLDVPPRGPPRVTVYHLGSRLGPAGEALLSGALTQALEAAPVVHDVTLDSLPVPAGGDPLGWLDGLEATLALAPSLDRVTGCFTGPLADPLLPIADSVRARLAQLGSTVPIAEGPVWQFRWTTGRCEAIAAPPPQVSAPGR